MTGLNEIMSALLIRTMLCIPLLNKNKQNFCLGLVGWCSCDDCQSVYGQEASQRISYKCCQNSDKVFKAKVQTKQYY